MLVNYIFSFQELLPFLPASNIIVVFNTLKFNVSETNSKQIHRSISEGAGRAKPRRESIFDVMRHRYGSDNKALDLEKLEVETSVAKQTTLLTRTALQAPPVTKRKISREARSDSVITPGLIQNLKKNKKRIVAKGL